MPLVVASHIRTEVGWWIMAVWCIDLLDRWWMRRLLLLSMLKLEALSCMNWNGKWNWTSNGSVLETNLSRVSWGRVQLSLSRCWILLEILITWLRLYCNRVDSYDQYKETSKFQRRVRVRNTRISSAAEANKNKTAQLNQKRPYSAKIVQNQWRLLIDRIKQGLSQLSLSIEANTSHFFITKNDTTVSKVEEHGKKIFLDISFRCRHHSFKSIPVKDIQPCSIINVVTKSTYAFLLMLLLDWLIAGTIPDQCMLRFSAPIWSIYVEKERTRSSYSHFMTQSFASR